MQFQPCFNKLLPIPVPKMKFGDFGEIVYFGPLLLLNEMTSSD